MDQNNQALRQQLNQAIDYDKVLDQISQYASFSCAKNAIHLSLPLSSLLEIQSELTLAKEFIDCEQNGIFIDFSGCDDISQSLELASKDMVLEGKQLSSIAQFLASVYRVKTSIEQTEKEKLNELVSTLEPCTSLKNHIFDCVDINGDIKDDATPTLKAAIRSLNHHKQVLSQLAARFVKKHESQLQEKVSTSMQGRICVLVKAQNKNSFGGLIHGQSQSGQAFYVEPTEFTSANNAVASARLEIEEEKARIARALSKEVARFIDPLSSNLDTMTLLNVAQAKAKWALAKDGVIPLIQTRDRSFHFEFARHPLLDDKSVVANQYDCDKNQQCIMISGPNMGGKTVSLKTIGLFMVLAHAGFPVIAHRATMPFYTSWFFDIGDQQSIENNLSTFSSHISNIAKICSQANEKSFVLLDEPGNGTDPLEGASLAQAILEFLMEKGCTILTSTHYNAMKSFGKTHPKILVSKMEFDENTLKPTYRYIPDVSGASYAFDVANLYHLEPSILARAQQLKEENTADVDKRLEELERQQNQVLKEKERFSRLIEDAHRLQKEAQETKEKVLEEKESLDNEYRDQLNEYLENKKEEAKEIIKQMRDSQSGKVHTQIETMHDLDGLYVPADEKEATETFEVGDYVQIKNLNTHGEIVDIRKKEATIDAHGKKVRVKLNQLTHIHRPQIKTVSNKVKLNNPTRLPMELNIIGYRVDEGLNALNHYIDQAVAHKMSQVRIIHGVGSGVLRRAVWKDLDKHPMVKSKMAAGEGDGGLGATIVTLK